MDYTAQGHTVGLAARMEQLAEPGATYLTADTAELVRGYFELEDLGEFQVKGVSEPVPAFALQGVGALRTRFDASRARGLTRFVGRDADVQTLEAALTHAREGKGRAVGVVGDAGVGKSRLCFEFAERCRARGINVLEGHAIAHGKNIPLLPVLEIFRAYFGIEERDDPRMARDKIAGRLLLIDENFRDVLPLMFDFLGVPDPERPAPRMDAEARQRRLAAVVRGLIERRNPNGFVLLIEDLHWADAASDVFLADWADAIAGGPGVLLVNFRPEYRAHWMQKSWYQQLPLDPLGPEAIGALLGDLLGSDASLAGLADRIHARTAGNPFFAEEIVRSLAESGTLAGAKGAYRLTAPVASLDVPDSVHAVLAARIDRLAEREKQLLQAAAVIGKEFSEPILAAVAALPGVELTDSLAALSSSEFIHEQALYPVAEYAFSHPLTQEVALDSQLHERRRRTHAAVARAIEEAHADRLDEKAALLAHHFEEAGEALEAARWHARAAAWIGTHDLTETLRHWQRVRELGRDLRSTEETLGLRTLACVQILNTGGWRLGMSDEDTDALYEEGRRAAERAGNKRLLGALMGVYSILIIPSGRMPEALELLAENRALADELGLAEARAGARVSSVYAHLNAGRIAEALALAEEGEEITGGDARMGLDIAGFSYLVWFAVIRSALLALLGRLDAARRSLERGLRLARESGIPENLGWARGMLTTVAACSGERAIGDLGDVRAAARQAMEIAEELGSAFSRVGAYNYLGAAQLVHEDWAEAERAFSTALELARRNRTGREFEAQLLLRLARARLGRGDAAGARRAAEEAVTLARERGQASHESQARIALARALCASGGGEARAAVEDELERASALLETTGCRAFAPRIAEARAELAHALGDEARWERELREAHRLYSEMGATGYAQRVAEELQL
jgi:adenylate cyclase